MLSSKFAEQVRQHPQKIAVKTFDQELTYSELDNYANGVAQRILEKCDTRFKLSDKERERYKRQLLIHNWGVEGQEKLKQTTVFVAGAGGSGSPLLIQLALCGFGTIIICDFDQVELSNLNRQCLHDETRIGINKAVSAQMSINRLNPEINIIVRTERISRENVEELVGDAVFVFDNVDDLETKFILSEVAVKKGIPHAISSMIDINSYAAIFHTPHTPCFHCLYDRDKLEEIREIRQYADSKDRMPNPVASPSLFLSTGFVCNEAIKIILGFENPAYNRYFYFNQRASNELAATNGHLIITYPFSEHFKATSLTQGFDWDGDWRGRYLEELEITHNPDCPLCGTGSDGVERLLHAEKEQYHCASTCQELSLTLTEVEQQVVALLFEHGADMLVGLIGALKSGVIYVPLDPTYPEKRLLYMLENSGAALIVTNEKNRTLASRLMAKVKNYLKVLNINELNPRANYEPINLGEDGEKLAYILYTSGSTGNPKGVYQSRKNVWHFIKNYVENFEITATDRLTLFSAFGHDAAVMDIYAALLTGATIYPVNVKDELNLADLPKWLEKEQITIYHSVPTVFRYFMQMLEGDEVFPYLRKIILGGEGVLRSDVKKFKELFPEHVVLANLYGQSESSYNSTQFFTHSSPEQITLGESIAGVEIFLLNEEGEEVEPLEIGEILVASEHIAHGYWKNPEKTAEVFADDDEFGRLYWTGDLGRLQLDGQIEFVGRKDFQIKIRGYRVELAEIESQLLTHPLVKEAVVIAKDDQHGNKELIGYLVTKAELSEGEVRGYLAKALPDYMIPAHLIFIEAMPLTGTNKVDRKALLGMALENKVRREFVPPADNVERELVAIWSKLLGIERIGVTNSFFDLGGHSLKATQLSIQVLKVMGVKLSLSQIFAHPTIREMAEIVRNMNQSEYEEIKPAPQQELYPVSSAQRRLYLLAQMEEVSTAYNMPAVVKVSGKLDIQRLEWALKEMVKRHETLRTSFVMRDGEILQHVAEDVSFNITQIKVGEEKETIAELVQDFLKPFELHKAPLLRVAVAQITEEDYVLMYDLHHIITDGTSMVILMRELSQLYMGGTLAPLRIQYKDYANWQNELRKNGRLAEEEDYWLETLKGELPILNLPTDFPRPQMMTFEGGRISFSLTPGQSAAVRKLITEHDATLYMTLLALYNLLLSKYSGQNEILIGTPIAGRGHADLENLIGMFVNTLVLRNVIDQELTFGEFLEQVKYTALKAFENQNYQFDMLVDKLNLERDLSRNPIFDVALTVQNHQERFTGGRQASGLSFEPYGLAVNTTKFDLNLIVLERDERVELVIEYRTDLYTNATIQRLIRHFTNLIDLITVNPEQSLKELELLTEEEKSVLLGEFNKTGADYPTGLAHHFFEIEAAKHPEKTALVWNGQNLTYGELNQRSNQLARLLQSKGIGPEQIVGIWTEDSFAMFYAILATLKAGAAYLPIDPKLPLERISYMLNDSGACLLLATDKLLQSLQSGVNSTRTPENIPKLVQHDSLAASANLQIGYENNASTLSWPDDLRNLETLNLDDEALYQGQTANLAHTAEPTNLAYVIYTSGSTGKPKGVLIEHKSLVNQIHWYQQYYQITTNDRIVKYIGFSFDPSVAEIFPFLGAGAEIHLIEEELKLDLPALNRYFHEEKITINLFPTQIAEQFMQYENSSLRVVITGGDKLKHFTKRNYELVNNYGPTENTITTTVYKVSDKTQNIPIGQPITNTQVYILNERLQMQPIGVYGELYIGGAGLARGYLNHPELTEEKFIANPFKPGERMYRTGDLARWLPDGNIQFLGRVDQQVKLRGYRIELGEIEVVLKDEPEVKDAVVSVKEDGAGDQYLCAYLTVHQKPNLQELRGRLATRLPEYMVPAYFVILEEIPLTVNGKVDRQALPVPVIAETGDYEAPQSEFEMKFAEIWKEVLGVGRVGLRDNFFTLGGHSLKATNLVARVYQEFQVNLSLKDVFKRPTLRELAHEINSLEKCEFMKIERAAEREYYPASSAQKRVFLAQQLEGIETAYNMPQVVQLLGTVDRARLEKTFQKLIQRHESLRTSFVLINGDVQQRIQSEVDFALEYLVMDSAEMESDEVRKAIKKLIRPFDLTNAPLLRVKLIKAKDGVLLATDLHHIISDGVSMLILMEEFVRLYTGEALAPLKIRYRDFAIWQNARFTSERWKKYEEFWLNMFAGELPLLDLPTDYPRPKMADYRGNNYRIQLSETLTQQLKELAVKQGATLYMVLLAAYNVLLTKYSNQTDLTVGTPIAGRPHPDLAKVIGMFVNTVPVRNQLAKDQAFSTFLSQVKEVMLKVNEYQEYPVELIINKLQLQWDLSRNPLFDTVLVLQNIESDEISLGELEVRPYPLGGELAKFDLTVTATERLAQLHLKFEYRVSLFKEATIQQMAENLKLILETVAEDAHILIKDIRLPLNYQRIETMQMDDVDFTF